MIMISSAVVIPEQETEPRPTSPISLKRRQSSISSDSSKRPRLETHNSSENGTTSNHAGAMSPPTKRRSALGVGAAEERKRGQRLFGSLLGTLSQKSSKPAHRKRDEIEQKQRERIRKDTEEREEEKRRKREELDESRRVEQKAWEMESMRIRHRNMRAMAGFLQTKTEPSLYFKPWELREEEEERIKQQKADVEMRIKAERGEDKEDESMQVGNRNVIPDQNREDSGINGDRSSKPDETTATDQHIDREESQNNKDAEADAMKIDDANNDTSSIQRKNSEDERQKDDDHAGEELVEGQEDDVIY